MEVSKVRSVDGVIFSQKRSETAHDDEKQYHTPQKPLQISTFGAFLLGFTSWA